MKNVHKNQSGVAALTIIGLLLIFAVVGFTGWRVWEARKDAKKQLESGNSQQATKTEPKNKEPSIPEGFVEYNASAVGLKYYIPKTQEPVQDVSTEHKPEGRAASYKLKNFSIEFYDTNNLSLQLGIGAPQVCDYNKDNNSFVVNKAKSFESLVKCDFKSTTFSNVAFHDQSTGYEARTMYVYGAPISAKKYYFRVVSTRDDGACYVGEATQAECNRRSAEQFEALNDFMRAFVPANQTLFK